MKILDRYIFKELLQIFVLGLLVLMSILILEKINFLSESIFNKGITVGELFQLILYISPAFLMVSIPLAILLSSLVVFSRLSADNEITAMRAGGVGFYRILLPVALLSVITWAICSHIAINVQHVGNLKFIESLTGIVSKQAGIVIGERKFFDRFPGAVIYVSEKPTDSNILKGIFISDTRDPAKRRIITAKTGSLTKSENGIVFKLQNGSVYSSTGKSFRLVEYDEYNLVLGKVDTRSSLYVKQPREMSIDEIKRTIAERAVENKTSYSEQVEIYKRYSLPFSSIVFGMLGAPLGMRVRRGGRWGGMGLGIALLLVNYLLFMMGEGLGKEGTIPPVLAMWFPNILVGSIAIFLIYTTARETMPFNITLWVQSKWLAVVGVLEGRKTAAVPNGKPENSSGLK